MRSDLSADRQVRKSKNKFCLSIIRAMQNKSMTKKLITIILSGALFFVFSSSVCYAKNYSEIEGEIKKGQSKQTIIKLLGEPIEKIKSQINLA